MPNPGEPLPDIMDYPILEGAIDGKISRDEPSLSVSVQVIFYKVFYISSNKVDVKWTRLDSSDWPCRSHIMQYPSGYFKVEYQLGNFTAKLLYSMDASHE